MNNSGKALVMGSSVVAAMVLIGFIFSGWFGGLIRGQFVPTASSIEEEQNDLVIASQNAPPKMVLTILNGDEDHSKGMASFDANNTDSIFLIKGQHIRFESPNYRMPDSMKAIAEDSGGNIHILLKSYDVNNEFFINLQKGTYELNVQARWVDKTYIYPFSVIVE